MKVAILVANGFDEATYLDIQKAMQAAGASITFMSADQSLVNGWRDMSWGLSFSADAMLSASLAADFDILCVPGGARAIEKMKLTAHTKRFVTGFLNAMKPVVMMNEASSLIEHCGMSATHEISKDGVMISNSLMTVEAQADAMQAIIAEDMMAFLASCMDMPKAA